MLLRIYDYWLLVAIVLSPSFLFLSDSPPYDIIYSYISLCLSSLLPSFLVSYTYTYAYTYYPCIPPYFPPPQLRTHAPKSSTITPLTLHRTDPH